MTNSIIDDVSFSEFLVINFDAKLSFDDNAKFRQSNIFDMEDTSESDQREVEATRAGLNYIGLQGNIGCLGKSIEILVFSINYFTFSQWCWFGYGHHGYY